MKENYVSFEAVQEEKRRERAEDARLLAEGLVTARELQDKNSFFPPGVEIRIADLGGYLRSRRAK